MPRSDRRRPNRDLRVAAGFAGSLRPRTEASLDSYASFERPFEAVPQLVEMSARIVQGHTRGRLQQVEASRPTGTDFGSFAQLRRQEALPLEPLKCGVHGPR